VPSPAGSFDSSRMPRQSGQQLAATARKSKETAPSRASGLSQRWRRIAKIARKGRYPAERDANERIGLFKEVNHATDQSRPKYS